MSSVLATVSNFDKSAGVRIVVEKRGTDDQYALGITEGFRYQTRHVLYHGLCPNRNVKSFLNHIYGPVRRLDEDRKLLG